MLNKAATMADDSLIGVRLWYKTGQLEKLRDKLDSFKRKQVVHQTLDEVAKLLAEELRRYPPQRHVSRREAYDVTFFSDRQRRWFFAALNSGELELPYSRTDALRDGWHLENLGSDGVGLINEVSYAGYVMGKRTQSRMMKLIGWIPVESIIKKYRPNIGRVAIQSIRAWLEKG
jgi:hypothetical protein